MPVIMGRPLLPTHFAEDPENYVGSTYWRARQVVNSFGDHAAGPLRALHPQKPLRIASDMVGTSAASGGGGQAAQAMPARTARDLDFSCSS